MGNLTDHSNENHSLSGSTPPRLDDSIITKAIAAAGKTLCYIRLDTDTFFGYGKANGSGDLDKLKETLSDIVGNSAAAEERDKVERFLSVETLLDRMALKDILALDFANVDGGHSHAQFTVAERQQDGRLAQVVFTSEEFTTKERIIDISDRHFFDNATGLLNHAGFERLKELMADDLDPVAFALIDIDGFKAINDSYGYSTGDKILTQLAEIFRSITREGDAIARIGGDEFAIILKNCPISASRQVVSKFESAHHALSEALPDGKPVTLSVGVCFSPFGFNNEVAARADTAMFEIKKDGHGGCALADENGNVFKRWFDESISRRHDATFTNTVGSWRIEMPADGSPRRMFCDDSMLRIGSEKRRESPEEVYKHWRGGLSSSDKERIDQAIQALEHSDRLSNVSFTWVSEDGGTLSVVSSVARDHNYANGLCFYGFFDQTRNKNAHKRENEIEMLNEALARSLVFGYVINLEHGTYATLRRPAAGPLSLIKAEGPSVSLVNAIRRFIADDEGEVAMEAMLDRASMPSRLAGIDHVYCDFLSTGIHGWCRAKLYTFKADGFDGLEKVILVCESIETDGPGRYVEKPSECEASKGAKTGRVLVIDDEEINRVILEDALSEDFEVVEAADGNEAYELIKNDPHAFAGIVTDLSMPNMGGEELLRRLERDGISTEVPVVVVTAENKAESENRCLEHGAIDFIRKPLHLPVARKRVNNVVELFRLQNHLRLEVERRTEELQVAYNELEDKSRWLREYAFRLSQSSARMIEAIGEIVEFRSVETGSHVTRVKHYTNALALHMLEMDPECGLTEEKVKLITEASPLHDVGKIAIPDAVLLKPGKLTAGEFECMKTHTTEGYRLLSSLDSIWEDGYRSVCEEICLCHHERYDGKGYPNGLKGEEIPLSAQIVSVADIFDALSSDRIYRPALSREETRSLILEGKVGSFSERMLRCFEETFPQLEEIAERITETGHMDEFYA